MLRFLQETQGAATIEFLIWTPVLVGLFILIVDFAYLFMVNASMWESARNAARSIAIHQSDTAAAEITARSSLVGNKDYQIVIAVDTETVIVRIALPARNAGLLSFVTRPLTSDLVAYILMPREPA